MNDKLAVKAKEALRESEFWTNKTRENGTTIQGLICPVCGDRSAYAFSKEPYAIVCNKTNKCGSKTNTRELFNITFDIEREYKPTANDKHRPAREYLKSRGIKNEILKDLDFRYWKDVRNLPTGAVMFPVGKDKNKKDIFNGRLFSPPANEGKTHNCGSTAGVFWTHPGRPLNLDQPVLITEGIIDALSLIQMGVQAVAVLSSGQDPRKLDTLNKYKLISAFDHDQAGINATNKFLKVFPRADAVMPPKGADWNDLLKHNTKEIGTYFKENETLFRQNAALAMANDAHQYGELFQEYFNRAPGLFVFNGCTWYGQMKTRGET